MAKGGSGDMLTGLIAGLLAQYPAEGAARRGSGGVSARVGRGPGRGEVDEHTLLPTDTLRQFSGLFAFAPVPSGYVWLQGLATESVTGDVPGGGR